jgi:hypothetical protein
MAVYRTVVECQANCSDRTIVRGVCVCVCMCVYVCVYVCVCVCVCVRVLILVSPGYGFITSTAMFRPGDHREDVPSHRTHHQLRYPGYTDRIPH